MRCLVLGAGGCIGSALVDCLMFDGHDVFALDAKPRAEWWSIRSDVFNLPGRDVRRVRRAEMVPLGIDWIFDLAEDKGGAPWIATHHADCLASSTVGTSALQLARDLGVERFFYASSACAYPVDRLDSPDAKPLVEGDAWPANPEGGYGLQKLYMEQLCAAASAEWGIETRVARFDTIYGPPCEWEGGREKVPAAICRKVAQAAASGAPSIEVIGDGEQTRTFLHVDDCVDAIVRLMASDLPLANVGADTLITINDLVELVQKVAGTSLDVVHVDGPQGARGRVLDSTLARTRLGWEPTVGLDDGIAGLYRWVAERAGVL